MTASTKVQIRHELDALKRVLALLPPGARAAAEARLERVWELVRDDTGLPYELCYEDSVEYEEKERAEHEQ